MRIITYSCPTCSTVIAANELEDNRIMKCPGLGCEEVIRFTDLNEHDRKFFLDHRDKYQL